MKVLIVENEKLLSEAIAWNLREKGFFCETVHTYSTAIEKAAAYTYDYIIVDVNFPDENPSEIIKTLKKISSAAGVIITSLQDSVANKTKGFPTSTISSAKPSSNILVNENTSENEITINEIKIIPNLYEVYINNAQVNLTKKEFDLLLYFIANRDRIITKELILEYVWGDYNKGSSDSCNFIYTHIKNLRKKMAAVGGKYYIKNVHRVGYKFKAD